MIKEILQSIDTGILGEIGLIAFVTAFVLVLLRVALMRRDERSAAKNLPFDEQCT